MPTATLPTPTAALEDDDAIYCDDCGDALTDAEIDESGYQCTTCYAATHFTCTDCGDSCEIDDASPKCKTRCQSCQETKDDAELEAKRDGLKDEAQELLEALCDDGDLDQLRKAVAALKRLQAA